MCISSYAPSRKHQSHSRNVGPSTRNLLHIILLAPGIWRWLLDFLNICWPLIPLDSLSVIFYQKYVNTAADRESWNKPQNKSVSILDCPFCLCKMLLKIYLSSLLKNSGGNRFSIPATMMLIDYLNRFSLNSCTSRIESTNTWQFTYTQVFMNYPATSELSSM